VGLFRVTQYMRLTSGRVWGLDPVVAVGLVIVFLFFLVSGVIAYSNVRTLRDDNQQILHSVHVLSNLNQLLSSAQDAETGQRGFLLTGDDKYLGPYNLALTALPSRLDDIAELTRDNPAQQARLPSLKQHVALKLAELKETIELRRTRGLEAALAVVNSDRGKVEMDAIRAQLAEMNQIEEDVRDTRVLEMNESYKDALTSGVSSGLLGILLTGIVGFLIRRAAVSRQLQEWRQSGLVGLAAAMQGDQQASQLGESILGFLAHYVGAVAGVLFVRHGQSFQRVSTYGVPAGSDIPEQVGRNDGLLGQSVANGRSLVIDDVPEGYLTFGSGLGRDKPRHIIVSPGSVDGAVDSVVELGFLRPIDDGVLALLDQASSSIAIATRTAKYRAELQTLLEDTQRQSEELQVQGEELRVSNEELDEQSRALKESQTRLEEQQAELEQINSQLEEQTQQLERQRDDLERANANTVQKAHELEQASRYKSDFLANMSHELRTPLNSSLILAKLLADNPDENLTAEQVEYARTIQSSGNDLLTLINDILDLSKIEAGYIEVNAEVVSLEGLFDDLVRLFQPVAQNKGLVFTTKVAPNCPAIITTDAQRFEQILKNLLSNAFKFTENGTVTLSATARRGEIAVSVVDTGIGIPEQHQHSVFDAFRQADGTISRQFGGTGLGLSISRELVRLLGGSIQLESRPGIGSTFTVLLPQVYSEQSIAAAASDTVTALPSLVGTPPANPRADPPRRTQKLDDDRNVLAASERSLLVIEDDDAFAAILRDLSREMGFRCLIASTAQDALTLAKQFTPSAIILDVGLPDQSGLAVLDRLKRNVLTRHIPIHVVSAGDHAQTALSLGAVGYMPKPIEREQLADVLRGLETKLSQRVRRVLVVEDDALQREAVRKLLTSQDVEVVVASTAAECLDRLKQETFDCMVLDLTLPDASGYSLLETLSTEANYSFPPVIVYTGRELSADDEQRLRRYSKSIIIKGAKSPERLLDEVTLFLHRVVSDLSDEQQKMIRRARSRDEILEGRRILVVEDDVRNVYAVTNILEPRGARIEIARNGREALDVLEKSSRTPALAIDLVLMDVMMPVMDGLTATREIRKSLRWKKLPIIALTAKAMPDDQARCIEAGASDYMAKPLDVDKLLSLVRVWMPR
jgi:signal transduction histidine kinase/DNA-binding response OmpR family regulator/CHASE3 domain sensor protein